MRQASGLTKVHTAVQRRFCFTLGNDSFKWEFDWAEGLDMAIAGRRFVHSEAPEGLIPDRTLAFIVLMPGLVFWAAVISVVIKFF